MSLKETVEILFLATDKTESVISGVGAGLSDLASPLAGATKKFLLLEAAVLAVGAAFAGKAFTESVKFESALLDLQKVLSDGEGNASDYTSEIDRMALKFGESGNEILQGAADIKQAGFTVAEAMKLQEDALTAAVISELSVNEATSLMIRSLKGFKAEASDATRILDLFNEVSNKNATNVRELATGFSEFAPVAQKLGLSFEEANALLVPIIETFGSGAEAGNALKIALTSLIVPTGPAADELARLGIAVRDSSGQLRKGRDITFELIQAMSTLAPTQQIATLAIIAGERQAARLSETFGNQAKVLKILKDQTTATGSAQKEFNIRIAATEKQIDKAGVAFNIMARTLGDRFKPELAGVIIGIRELQQAFTDVIKSGDLDPFLQAITPQLDKLGKLFSDMAKALPEAFKSVDFGPITDALESIFGQMDGLFDGLDLGKPEDLAKAINGLIKVGASFISTTEGIISVLGPVGGVIMDLVGFYSELTAGTKELIGSIGGASIVLSSLAGTITAIGLAFGAISGIGGPLMGLVAILTGPIGITVAIGAVVAAMANWASGTNVDAIKEEIESLKNSVVRNTDEIESRLDSLGYDSWDAFQEAVKNGAVIFEEATGEWIDAIDGVSEAARLLEKVWVETADGMVEVTREQAEEMERTKEAAKGLGEQWEVVGDTIVRKGGEAAALQRVLAQEAKGYFEILEDGSRVWVAQTTSIVKYTGAVKEATEANKEADSTLTKRVETLAKFRLGLEEIQSKERISKFTMDAEVNMEKIKAATELFKNMTDTIQTGIQSTGESITSLFEILADGSSRYNQDILDAIEQEQEWRERQFKLQEELAQAQIDLIRARIEAMNRGEAIINVSAEGLEPHLQEVLRSIIEYAKVEATASAQDYLLGIEGLGA